MTRLLLLSVITLLCVLAVVTAQADPSFDAATSDATSDAPDAMPPPAEPPDATPPASAAPSDAAGLVEKVVDSARRGQWRLMASAVLALLMLVLARWRAAIPLFAGDRGGALLVGLLGLGGAFASALATEAPLDWKLLLGALGVTWTAVGGVTWAKRLIWPKDTVPA